MEARSSEGSCSQFFEENENLPRSIQHVFMARKFLFFLIIGANDSVTSRLRSAILLKLHHFFFVTSNTCIGWREQFGSAIQYVFCLYN